MLSKAKRKDRAAEMMKQFVLRSNPFAMQTQQGTYVPVRREITKEDIIEHLRGRKTYGVYQVDDYNMVKFGVIDFDKPEQEQLARKIASDLQLLGHNVMLEASGSEGHFHVWMFEERQMRL